MSVWNTATPAGTDPKSQGDDRIRELKQALQDALQAAGTASFPGPNPLTAPVFYPVIERGLAGSKPGASVNYAGRMWWSYDTGDIERVLNDGSAWEVIGKSPTSHAIHQAVAVSLASVAGIVTLDETTNSKNVTGTEAVTALQGWSAGIVIIKWVSSRVLTHSSTFSLKDGVSRTCTAGDISIFEFTASNTVREIAAIIQRIAPTRQVLTSGSGATYTTPTNCKHLKVRMIGGGGGGAAVSTNAGSAGNDTIFNSIHAAGGNGGSIGTTGNGGAGGSGGSGSASLRCSGGSGGQAPLSADAGGFGGNSHFGGGGRGFGTNLAGEAAATNSGAGGGGGATNSSATGGGGGGSGEYVELEIDSPAATYTYTVGTGGNGGAAGGFAGGNGAAGVIVIDEFYA